MGNIAVIDTEATPIVAGVVDGKQSMTYDFGYVIVDDSFNIVKRGNAIIEDVFSNPQLMKNAYYRSKLSWYYETMRDNKSISECINFNDALNNFRRDIKAFEVNDVYAYNCKFDRQTLNFTLAQCSNGFAHYFMPYKTVWHDIWDIAQSITGTKKYVDFCLENGYVTKQKYPLTKVDTVGKFLWGIGYTEKHTALSDATDEMNILKVAFEHYDADYDTIGKGSVAARKLYKLMYR